MCQFVVRCSCSTTSFDKGSRYGRLEADHAASMAVRSNECPALVTARAGVSREEERERKLFSSRSRLARRDALTGSRYNTCVIGHRSSGGSSTVRGGRAILFTKRLRSVQKKRQKTAPSCCRHARNTETKVDKGVERVRRTFSGAASSLLREARRRRRHFAAPGARLSMSREEKIEERMHQRTYAAAVSYSGCTACAEDGSYTTC